MLWICLYFPQLPLDSYPESRGEQAWVIETQHRGKRLVSHANAAARQAGIQPGTSLPTAHSLATPLHVRAGNPRQEHQILEHLACLAYHFTPHVCLLAPDTLLLEVSRCLRLFGGVDALRHQLSDVFQQEPYVWCSAMSDTPRAARILARQAAAGAPPSYTPAQALAHCPLSLTDIPLAQQEQLISMGLHTLGDVLALPNGELARRFSPDLVTQLQHITGEQADPLPVFRLPRHFSRQLDFDSEASHHEQLLFPIKHLLHNLETYLAARQLCARSLVLKLVQRQHNGQSLVLQPGKAAYRAAHFLTLIRHQLERLSLEHPVTGLHLEVRHFNTAEPETHDLFAALTPGKQASSSEQFALIDRLRARLGDEALYSLALHQDHRPEKAWQAISPALKPSRANTPAPTNKHTTNAPTPADTRQAERPLWLLPSPRKLASKKGLPLYGACLQLLKGPERIDAGWWDGENVQRDYYIAKHPNGARLWVFRAGHPDSQWFLQGVFG